MGIEDDEDLADLLKTLKEEGVSKKEEEEEEEIQNVVILPKKKRELPEPEEIEESETVDEDFDIANELSSQFNSVISKVGEVADEIIKNYRSDRNQAQQAIDHFFDVIGTGGKIPTVYIEKLSDVLRAKNEISQNAIRVLDSISKFMTATKNNELIVNNFNNNANDFSDLEKILNAEKYDDE